MFTTALIWGVGVSCGASIGLLLFLVLKVLLDWMLGKTAYRKAVSNNEKSLDALNERNRLTVQMIDKLSSIAEAANRANPAPSSSADEHCPHAAPHSYCAECKETPCPIGLSR